MKRKLKITVAFDVDGTLIHWKENGEGIIKATMFDALIWWYDQSIMGDLLDQHIKIIVWSGGGKEYAESVCRRFGLTEYVSEYRTKDMESATDVDICYDDQVVELAKINIRVF
jgi:phosphoserine phosphatase